MATISSSRGFTAAALGSFANDTFTLGVVNWTSGANAGRKAEIASFAIGARIAKSRLLGARWPATLPPRLQRLPTMQPGEFLATTNEI